MTADAGRALRATTGRDQLEAVLAEIVGRARSQNTRHEAARHIADLILTGHDPDAAVVRERDRYAGALADTADRLRDVLAALTRALNHPADAVTAEET